MKLYNKITSKIGKTATNIVGAVLISRLVLGFMGGADSLVKYFPSNASAKNIHVYRGYRYKDFMDINRDGFVDKVDVSRGENDRNYVLRISYGKGDGTFTPPEKVLKLGKAPRNHVFTYLNKDGILDFKCETREKGLISAMGQIDLDKKRVPSQKWEVGIVHSFPGEEDFYYDGNKFRNTWNRHSE